MGDMMNIKVAISLVLFALVAVFVLQNTKVVEIQFLWWSLAMSRALVIFFVLAIGVVAGWLLASHFSHKRGRK